MWHFEVTAETTGDPRAVWAAWEDAEHWNRWNPMIQDSRLEGPFAVGTRGMVVPTKGPTAGFVLTDVQPGTRWASRARMPGSTMDFIYTLTPVAGGTRITVRSEISGPLSPLFGILVGRQCRKGLPPAVENLKALAERPAAV